MPIQFTPRVKLFIIFLVAFWASICYMLVGVSFPNNVLSPYFTKNKFKIVAIIPQGWGFFTRNPREARHEYYYKQADQWIKDPNLRNGTLRNVYGLDRSGRLALLLYGRIEKKIPGSAWITMKDYDFKHFDFKSPSLKTVRIQTKKQAAVNMPTDIIIVQKEITPWAYRAFESNIGLPVSVVKLHINYQ